MNRENQRRAAKLGGEHARKEMEGTTYADRDRVFEDDDIFAMFDESRRVPDPEKHPTLCIIGVDPGDSQPGSCYGLVAAYCETHIEANVRRVVDRIIIKAIDNFSARRAAEACLAILHHIRQIRAQWPNVTIAIGVEAICNQVCIDLIAMYRRPEFEADLRDVHLYWENWTSIHLEMFNRPGPGIWPNTNQIDDSMIVFRGFVQNSRIVFAQNMSVPYFDREVSDLAKKDRASIVMNEFFNQMSAYKCIAPKGVTSTRRGTYTGKSRDGDKDDMVAALRAFILSIIATQASTDKAAKRGAAARDQVEMNTHIARRLYGGYMPVEPVRTPLQIYEDGKAIAGGPVAFTQF